MAAATTTSSDDPFQSISNFFDSSTWSVISFTLKAAVVVLWLALIFWTWRDARQRIREPALILGATVLSVVLPFVGTIIYLFLRPSETLADAHERELEVTALERRVGVSRCPECDYPVEPKFLSCPSCLHKLRDSCSRCGEALDPRWKICPYCETVVSPGFSPLGSDTLS